MPQVKTILENPFPIEQAPRTTNPDDPSNIPLFLIHDGGGTIVSYTLLGSLHRSVYGIHNPKFYEGGVWSGGLPAMAEHYTELIRSATPKGGKLLLGGWSLGGLLSNQVAYNLASSASDASDARHVLGIVMIDSPCPLTFKWATPTVRGTPVFATTTNAETRTRVANCMAGAGEMLKTFELPEWRDEHSAVANVEGPPPPTVLIRCRESVPVADGAEPGAVSRVDVARGSRTLGWDEYWRAQGFARLPVLETNGHHFNLFEPAYLTGVTEQISRACDMLLEGSRFSIVG